MVDCRYKEVMHVASRAFLELRDGDNIPEDANTEQQSADHGSPESGRRIEMLAQGCDEIGQDTFSDNRGSRRTGERSDEDFEGTAFGVAGRALKLKNLADKVATERAGIGSEKTLRLDGRAQNFDKEQLLRSEAAVHIGNIDIGIGRDVAQPGILIGMPGKSTDRRLENALLGGDVRRAGCRRPGHFSPLQENRQPNTYAVSSAKLVNAS